MTIIAAYDIKHIPRNSAVFLSTVAMFAMEVLSFCVRVCA